MARILLGIGAFLALLFLWALGPEWASVALVALFGSLTAWFSYLAYLHSKERFRLDLFEKRMEFYNEFVKMCAAHAEALRDYRDRMGVNGDYPLVAEKELYPIYHSFLKMEEKAIFLFGSDIISELKETRTAFNKLVDIITADYKSDIEFRQRVNRDSVRHKSKMRRAVTDMENKLKPYIYFGNYRSENHFIAAFSFPEHLPWLGAGKKTTEGTKSTEG
ncbi:MAG: hypothetical protein JKP92_09225 [Alphaproteobacteria bacterium]|jgi:hypothetical protein|nr:hypothetical protein [Alphaproteobacteria bacterium]